MSRDWTPSDQADAADADAYRNWWRAPDLTDPQNAPDELFCGWCSKNATEHDWSEEAGDYVCTSCLERMAEGAITQ